MTPLLTKLLAGQLVPVDAAVSFSILVITSRKSYYPDYETTALLDLLDYEKSRMLEQPCM